MNDSTRAAVEAVCSADPTIAGEMVSAALEILSGIRPVALVQPQPLDYVLSREDVARRLGISKNRVDHYARTGALKRVVVPGSSRAVGFSAESYRKLFERREATGENGPRG